MMRIVGRQTYRPNEPSQSPEDYYRINLFIPVWDHFITSLTNRFSAHQWMAFRASALIPSMIENKFFSDLKDCVNLYEEYLPSTSAIKEEFELYKRKWLNEAPDNRPTNATGLFFRILKFFYKFMQRYR
jgi:hypothetical protein